MGCTPDQDDGQFCHGQSRGLLAGRWPEFSDRTSSFPQDISCSLSRDQQDHPEGLPGVWARLYRISQSALCRSFTCGLSEADGEEIRLKLLYFDCVVGG